jgi:hypothetical protein
MITGLQYDLGRIVDCNGAGSNAAQLTNSYTPAAKITIGGVGNLALRCSVTLDDATAVYLRLMDYTDQTKPRALAFAVPGGAYVTEYSVTESSDFDLVTALGGVLAGTICVEKKCDGTPTADDALTVDAVGSEKF